MKQADKKKYVLGLLAPHSQAIKDEEWDKALKMTKAQMVYSTTRRTGGTANQANGATHLVRLASSVGIEHSLITRYEKATNDSGKPNTSGISINNDAKKLKEIGYAFVQHHLAQGHKGKALVQAMIDTLTEYGNPSTDDEEDTLNIGDIEIDAPPTNTIDIDAIMSQQEEEEEASASEEADRTLIHSINDITHLLTMTDEEAHYLYNAGREIRFKPMKNGEGVEMKMSGKKNIPVKLLAQQKQYGDDYAFHQVAFEALRISPRRQVSRPDHCDRNGKPYKSIGAFTELFKTNDPQKNANRKTFLRRIGAWLLVNSGANFYNYRMAFHVTEEASVEILQALKCNEEVKNAPVYKGRAESWNWPYTKADWKNNTTSTVDKEGSFSLNDL